MPKQTSLSATAAIIASNTKDTTILPQNHRSIPALMDQIIDANPAQINLNASNFIRSNFSKNKTSSQHSVSFNFCSFISSR